MASFFELEDEEFHSIPALEMDSRNWQEYHTALDQVVAKVGLSSYLVGTVLEGFQKSWDTQAKFLVTSALPDSILANIIHFDTAYKIFNYLQQRYEHNDKSRSHSQARQSQELGMAMYVPSHGRRRERKCNIEDLRRVEKRRKEGREGEKASARARGHEAAAMTVGMS